MIKFMLCISRYYNRIVVLAVFAICSVVYFYAKGANGSEDLKLRIALLGDSMTWIGGDSCQNPVGWSHYLKESVTSCKINVYARSGATWTNTPNTKANTEFYSEVLHDDNVVYNQMLRLIKDTDANKKYNPDAVVIFAGANDAWFYNKRPGIFDGALPSLTAQDKEIEPSMVTSLFGSVCVVCKKLKNIFPYTKIVLVTPIEMSKVSAEMIARVSDIIESAGDVCGVTTLRADRNVAIRHIEEKNKPRYTYDGVHTNAEGARMLGEYIVGELKIDNLDGIF